MKIDINRIPPEGLAVEESIAAGQLDLDTETCVARGPVKLRGDIDRITNTVTIRLLIQVSLEATCSRCLNTFPLQFKKDLSLSYPIAKNDTVLDITQDIREEIMLDYSVKPLCSQTCKGLCPKCGKNLNEGGCCCATTQKTTL